MVELIWATPNAEALITKMARVSNPSNEDNLETAPKLLHYLVKHKHWSPFEMANMCVKIHTQRDISAQILRHRSFTYQEFCLAGDSRITITSEAGIVQRIPIKELYVKWQKSSFKACYARSYDVTTQRFITAPIKNVYSSGKKDVYSFEIKTSSSYKTIKCTREHRVLTKEKGFVPFGVAYDEQLTVGLNGDQATPLPYQDVHILESNAWMGSTRFAHEFGIAEVTARKWFRKRWTLALTAKWGKIISQKYIGVEDTYDIEMDHLTHNFVADGVIVHNSTRYSEVTDILEPIQLRRQDHKNRQNSIEDLDYKLLVELEEMITNIQARTMYAYKHLLASGVAKECARRILPLNTNTTMYMNGTLRSWIHYIQLRTGLETQKEHRMIAQQIKDVFCAEFPVIATAAFNMH